MKLSGHAAERTSVATASVALDHTIAPPLAPVEPIIDMDHLARMTLGETSLEREVLQLFDRQSAMLLARMANEAPKVVGALAHTLTGSARGIGAWKVAAAAEAVERDAIGPDHVDMERDLARLSAAVAEAQAAIAEMARAR
jgi:HPt (histidine-containing phosphotransfer) domain-containing protein